MAEANRIGRSARENPRKVGRLWPTPEKMTRTEGIAPEKLLRMKFLDVCFHHQLLSAAHLKWPGLVRSAAPSMDCYRDENVKARLQKSRADVFSASSVMLLALLSDVEIELHHRHAEELQSVWTVLASMFGFARPLYETRYEPRLRSSS
jgi:hypothetical protein